jgi:hypothetical protein
VGIGWLARKEFFAGRRAKAKARVIDKVSPRFCIAF